MQTLRRLQREAPEWGKGGRGQAQTKRLAELEAKELDPILGQLDQPGSRMDRSLLADDPVGKAMDEATLPPGRRKGPLEAQRGGVEGGSARIPPADRAKLAGELGDVRRPMRSFSEVMKDVGGLFQKDWWTRLTNLFGRSVGPDRAVRSAMIRSRLYTGIEGGRMTLAFKEWIGRNREVLGLAVRGQDRGKATAVKMTEGSKAPTELAQRLDHIAAYPEKYSLTTEQRAAWDELQRMTDQVMQMEQLHNVDVDALLDDYISRIVIKAPRGEPVSSMRKRLGTRPWYTKQRAIPDLEQGYAAGFRYADPLTSMEARFGSSAETIGNQVAVDEVKRMGGVYQHVLDQVQDMLPDGPLRRECDAELKEAGCIHREPKKCSECGRPR